MEKSDLYLQEEEKEEKKKGRKRAESLASQSPLDSGFTLASIHSEWKRHGGGSLGEGEKDNAGETWLVSTAEDLLRT